MDEITIPSILSFVWISVVLYPKFSTCLTTHVTIDHTNCINNITWKIQDNNPTVQFYSVITSQIVSQNCLLHIYNEDFVGNAVYKAYLELYTNFSIYHQFSVGIYIGHPDLNKPVKILNDRTTKWSGHVPLWDLYVSLVSHQVDTFNVRLTIQKCLEHCYKLNTPSIIPTHIINVPDKCGETYCIDNFAVSYHIRTNFHHPKPCKIDFSVMNSPPVCITIGDHWKDAIIKSTKCRQAAIKIGSEIVATFDRLIFKPWCLPWTLNSSPLSVSWNNDDVGVSGQSLCTVTLYTNTSNHGDICQIQTTTVPISTTTIDNTNLMTAVTVSLSILIVLAIVIVYVMLKRHTCRQQGDGRRMVTNIHQHSSVCVMSPPPYSVAVQEESPCETGRVTINPSGQNGTVHFHCETSVGNSLAHNRLPDLPPPYSES